MALAFLFVFVTVPLKFKLNKNLDLFKQEECSPLYLTGSPMGLIYNSEDGTPAALTKTFYSPNISSILPFQTFLLTQSIQSWVFGTVSTKK